MTEKTKRTQSSTSILIFVVAGTAILSLIIGLAALSRSANTSGTASFQVTESDFTGVTPIDPPQDVPDFTLTNQEGKEVSLSNLRGKPTLIFFGFTHCPDICPTTLSEYLRLNEAVGPDKANFVFISIDGERDTPAAMKQRFEASRTPFVVGLTGDLQIVLKDGAPFNVVAEHGPKDDSGNYDIAHTASIFVLNAQGQWVAKYDYGTVLAVMIADLKARL